MRKLVLSLLGASAALGMTSAANAQLSIVDPTTVGSTTPVTGSVNFTSTYSDQSPQTPFELLVSFMIDQDGYTSFAATTTQNPDPVNGGYLASSDVNFTGGWISGLCSSPQPNPADATCSGLTHLGDLNFTSPDGGITENGSLVGLFLTAGSYTFHLAGTRGAESSFSGTLNYAAAPGQVPEPATWAMMLLGFGAVGWQMRRRRAPLLAQAA